MDERIEVRLEALRKTVHALITAAENIEAIEAFRIKVLGKKGELTELLRSMGSLPAEERPIIGAKVNAVRVEIEQMIETAVAAFRAKAQEKRLAAETIDVTQPVAPMPQGRLHPLTLTQNRLVDIFVGLGFTVTEGPEIELDHFNFELLNVPKNHAARDMQDSFYFNENIVLRTHTSPVQARAMQRQQPPIRIVCPGRCYRVDEVDATHAPVFHQMECLVIDEGITMGDLKGTLDLFLKAYFGPETKTRLRPSYFPFTEPSAEVDVSCAACGGEGCSVCRGSGWIEVLGCGMVNPKVLALNGIDTQRYSGFAFGVGVDRITSLRYNVSDIRLYAENDVRFLAQFA